jgi:uncharacterized membrane protein AbrB (regulator of aidB expression)
VIDPAQRRHRIWVGGLASALAVFIALVGWALVLAAPSRLRIIEIVLGYLPSAIAAICVIATLIYARLTHDNS